MLISPIIPERYAQEHTIPIKMGILYHLVLNIKSRPEYQLVAVSYRYNKIQFRRAGMRCWAHPPRLIQPEHRRSILAELELFDFHDQELQITLTTANVDNPYGPEFSRNSYDIKDPEMLDKITKDFQHIYDRHAGKADEAIQEKKKNRSRKT